MTRLLMILLIAIHPHAWRNRYGEEFQALLEAGPLTARVVLDVLRNAARQHARVHRTALRAAAALILSIGVEVLAGREHLTANILWTPSTPARAIALLALLLPWPPVAKDLSTVARRRRGSGDSNA